MVDWWISLVGAAVPALVAGQALRMKNRRAEEQKLKSARGREKSSDDIFVCERVCTSKRMLNKVGAFSKDPNPDTCVTVCGVSELDACADACARTVCVNQHQVPNWNDICLKRCQKQVDISKLMKKWPYLLTLLHICTCWLMISRFRRFRETLTRVCNAVIRLHLHFLQKPEPVIENSTDQRCKCLRYIILYNIFRVLHKLVDMTY
ncbi:hypothetical protein LXL04_020728 [Taraxacum kok-saghyz]